MGGQRVIITPGSSITIRNKPGPSGVDALVVAPDGSVKIRERVVVAPDGTTSIYSKDGKDVVFSSVKR